MYPRFSFTEDLPFKDFTFKCKDGEVKANKCILWSRCAFFKTTAWNIEGMVELEVEQTVAITQKVVNYFYGKIINMVNPKIDFDTFALINKLNPSPNNVLMLIPIDSKTWNDVLEMRDKYESVGCSYDQLISCIVDMIIENNMDVRDISTVNIDIFRKLFINDNAYDYILIELLARISVTDDEFDELFNLIRFEYVTSSLENICYYNNGNPLMYDKILSKSKKVTKESIRQAFLFPAYRNNYSMIMSIERANPMYHTDQIRVLGIKYDISDIFKDEKEFNSIIERY